MRRRGARREGGAEGAGVCQGSMRGGGGARGREGVGGVGGGWGGAGGEKKCTFQSRM